MSTADTVSVLTSIEGKLAAKRFKAGATIAEPADVGRRFGVEVRPVEGIEGLSRLLSDLESRPTSHIVRDEPWPGIDKASTRRDSRSFHDVPRRWLCLDIDSLGLPSYIDGKDAEAVVRFVIENLPKPFHQVSAHYQLSASMGLAPALAKVHLFYWLDRAIGLDELKAWLRESIADSMLFRPVQMIYTARPIFERESDDPYPTRSGLLRGTIDQVTVPPIRLAQARRSQGEEGSTAQRIDPPEIERNENGKVINGREQLLLRISYEVAAELFHDDGAKPPTVKELADEINERFSHGADLSDGKWTRADVEAKARARLADYERGFTFRARGQGSPLYPGYPASFSVSPMPIAQGRAKLGGLLTEAISDIVSGKRRSLLIEVTTGTGKTRLAATSLNKAFKEHPALHVAMYTARHELAEAFLETLDVSDYVDVRHIKGMIDNNDPTKSLCQRAPYVKALIDSGVSVRPNACYRNTDLQCHFYGTCPYYKQFRRGNDLKVGSVSIYTHSNLKFPRHPEEPVPDLIIVDEAILGAVREEASLDISKVRYNFLHLGQSRDGDRLADSFLTGGPVLDILRDMGVDENWLNSLHFTNAEVEFNPDAQRAEVDGFSDSREVTRSRNALKAILIEELRLSGHHHTTRAWYDSETQSIDMSWLSLSGIIGATDGEQIRKTPIIVLDATADHKLWEQVLDRELEFHKIDVAQNTHVVQVCDKTGSNSYWNDDLRGPRTHFTELVTFLNEQVRGGSKPLVISHKALADELRNEGSLSREVAVDHFGNIRGTNAYERCDVVVITGRNQLPPDAIEAAARAVWWKDKECLTQASFESGYQTIGYLMANHQEKYGVDVRSYHDIRVQAIQTQTREDETIQALARIRAVNSPIPKKVFLLSNLPVEIPVNRLVKWNDLMPDRAEIEFVKRRNLPISPKSLRVMRPDLARTQDNAQDYIRRSRIADKARRLSGSPEAAQQLIVELRFRFVEKGRPRGVIHHHLFLLQGKDRLDPELVQRWKQLLEDGDDLMKGWGEISLEGIVTQAHYA